MNKKGIYIIQDDKFNEVYLSLRIIFDLKSETVTKGNLLNYLFSDRLEKYPTKKSITEAQDLNYGVKFSSNSYSIGKYQVIELSLLGINEKFVSEPLHEAYVDLLLETLYRPLINDETLKEAKKNVKQSIKRSQENPSHYAILKAFELAGEGQPFGIPIQGYLEEVDDITVEDIKTFHQFLLESTHREVYVMGDVKSLTIDNMVPLNSNSVIKTEIKHKKTFENQSANQSEIVQIYPVTIDPDHDLYYAYLLFLVILGQSPTSYLFRNIREKESLAYSIYASQLIYDGVFYVMTSVDPTQEAHVMKRIADQFDIIRNDNLNLESAKQYIINRMEGISESPRKSIDFIFRNNRLNLSDTPDDLIKSFEAVSEKDVKAVLDCIGLPYTFVYRGVQHEEINE